MHAVVNRDHQRRTVEKRRLMMRHVNDINALPLQSEGNRDVIPPQRVFVGLIELSEIRRQRSKLVKVAVRSNQQIVIAFIDRTEIPDEIPDVGSHSEFIDFADVDRDAHRTPF